MEITYTKIISEITTTIPGHQTCRSLPPDSPPAPNVSLDAAFVLKAWFPSSHEKCDCYCLIHIQGMGVYRTWHCKANTMTITLAQERFRFFDGGPLILFMHPSPLCSCQLWTRVNELPSLHDHQCTDQTREPYPNTQMLCDVMPDPFSSLYGFLSIAIEHLTTVTD